MSTQHAPPRHAAAPPSAIAERHGLGELVIRDEIDLTRAARPQKNARTKVHMVLSGRYRIDDIHSVALVIDELVGNAITHTSGPVSMAVEVYEGGVAVMVIDPDPDVSAVSSPPADRSTNTELQHPDISAESGRGMFLMKMLATAVVTERVAEGKRIMAIFT